MGRWKPLAITPAMIALLRWYALPQREQQRRWKKRPKPNKAQKLALIRRGLVTRLETGDLREMVADITPKGRELLKAVRTAPVREPDRSIRAAGGFSS